MFIYSHNGNLLYMLVYVDGIIVTGNNPRLLEHIIWWLSTTFVIQDMGRPSYFPGIEVVSKGKMTPTSPPPSPGQNTNVPINIPTTSAPTNTHPQPPVQFTYHGRHTTNNQPLTVP
jgi:hypothetical protein